MSRTVKTISMQSRPDRHCGILRCAGRGAVLLGLVLGLAGSPALGQKPALAMLDGLDSGKWELNSRDGSRPRERICLKDGRRLLQLQHAAAGCERLVVDDTPAEVTVQYSCKGRGFGRTTIRRESSRLIQIDSQGIAEGLPFQFSVEGRYLGSCTD